MRLYVEVARASRRRLTAYRGATVAGVVTNTVFGFINAYVLLAVFRQRSIGGFDDTDAVTFVFGCQALLMVVNMFARSELPDRIRTGDVALDLARPYDYQAWWGAVAYGRAAFYLVARGVPPFVVGALALPLRVPADPRTWLVTAVSVTIAVGLSFAFVFLIDLAAFWLVDVRGLRQFSSLVAQFLSGLYVPLVLFPDRVEAVLRTLPFAGMMQVPVEVFLGKHHGGDLLAVVAAQLAWTVTLLAAGRLVLRRAVTRIEVQGG